MSADTDVINDHHVLFSLPLFFSFSLSRSTMFAASPLSIFLGTHVPQQFLISFCRFSLLLLRLRGPSSDFFCYSHYIWFIVALLKSNSALSELHYYCLVSCVSCRGHSFFCLWLFSSEFFILPVAIGTRRFIVCRHQIDFILMVCYSDSFFLMWRMIVGV